MVKRTALAVGLVSFILFLVVTVLVFSGVTQGIDASLALGINNAYLGSSLTQLLVLSTEYGREYFWIPVVGVMFVFGNRDTKLLAFELAALFVVGIAAGELMKYAVYRARPFETVSGIVTRVATDMDSSFPSGHALIVSIGAAFVLGKFKSRVVSSLLAIEAAVVCYSRVYVGMHYPLDVVGGILLGVAIAGAGVFVLEGYFEPLLQKLTTLAVKLLRDGHLRL